MCRLAETLTWEPWRKCSKDAARRLSTATWVLGKTTFLQCACEIWAETGFADTILGVDLASTSRPVRDIRSLVEALWSQLPPTATGIAGDMGCGGNGGSRVRALLQHVKESRALVIIDGLDAIFTRFPLLESPAIGRVGVMREFLKQLFAACNAGSNEGSMIVFAGRHPPSKPQPGSTDRLPLAWLHAMFKTKRCIMQLEGLAMYDSLMLSADSIRRSAVLSPPQLPDLSDPGTRDDMELLCWLLLGIPGAILSLVPDAEASWHFVALSPSSADHR